MAKKKLTFEEALKALESIAEQIERGQIGLEESIARYEEGMGLIRHCREILARAELQIQQLQATEQGEGPGAGLDEIPPGQAPPESLVGEEDGDRR